ncbi:MAG: hypothetical protein ACHQ1D_03870 [Nitrososphaerales archaeon]
MNEKIAIGVIGVVLSVLLVIQFADVFAQQIVTNSSINSTTNTTISNSTNTTAIRNAFDQLKDTFGSIFGK